MRAGARGFTLIELAVVLTLIAVVIGGGVVVMTASLQASQYNVTIARMDTIEKAILNFSVANNRIPCPSNLTQTSSSTTYGYEAGAGSGSAIATGTGACTGTGMLPQANFTATSGTVEGGVPTRALRLPDDYIYDGWGRKFRYAVDPTYTKSNALPVAASCGSGFTPDTSAITVNDASGAARTTAGIYGLISHGPNGHGAYTSAGVVLNAGSVNANELTNCHCNSSGAATTYSPSYIEEAPTSDPNNALDDFDDIVTFKEPWQMQTLNYPLTAANCTQYIYVADWNNNRVEVFTTGGTYLSQFGTSGNGNGQFNHPGDLAIDSSGNLWVTDNNNSRVQKFSSSGTWLASLGGTSSACANCLCTSGTCPAVAGPGNGQLNTPQGARLDSSGNIWVADYGNVRVEEFSGSGAYLNQFSVSGHGGVANEIAIDSGNNVWVNGHNQYLYKWNNSGAYQSSLAPASLGHDNYMGFDSGGNIYVTDAGNNNAQKLNSGGTLLLTIGSSGSGNGQLSEPNGIAIDSSGNIWVADGNNNRVQEFSSSGAFLMSIGGTASACSSCACTSGTCPISSGSGNGQFNCPAGIAIGSR